MHRTALFLVVPLAVHASARQLASPPASTRRQPRGQRGRRPRMQCGWAGKGGGGGALPAVSPRGTRGAWICRIRAGARRSECPKRAAERWSHSRAGERWEGRAAGASVRETQHLGAEQLHGAPQAGPAPRSPPLGAGGPRRPPHPPGYAPLRPPRPAPAAGGDPARGRRPSRRVGVTTLPRRPRGARGGPASGGCREL